MSPIRGRPRCTTSCTTSIELTERRALDVSKASRSDTQPPVLSWRRARLTFTSTAKDEPADDAHIGAFVECQAIAQPTRKWTER